MWDWGPILVGQKIPGWARYGQMKADNEIFIHVNFQEKRVKK